MCEFTLAARDGYMYEKKTATYFIAARDNNTNNNIIIIITGRPAVIYGATVGKNAKRKSQQPFYRRWGCRGAAADVRVYALLSVNGKKKPRTLRCKTARRN